MRYRRVVRAAVVVLVGATTLSALPVLAQPAVSAGPEQVSATLDRYCVTCHNDRLRTAELSLEGLDPTGVADSAGTWEAVVRRLRLQTMPPIGRPRPETAVYDAVASTLETALDQVAAAAPDPGRRPALHRLSRTEYQNAVRDLLALDNLPKELDIAVMLPADNATSGFDNLADLLFVSPTLMERYLGAARKVSRLAVGDSTMLPIVDTYRIDRDLVQDGHLEGMPLGTRGGTRVETYLPLDGEYLITVEFPGAVRQANDLEVSVDGQRVGLFTVGETQQERTASGVFTFEAEPDVQVRVPLRAGPRDIAVGFLPKSAAATSGVVRSGRARSRQPSIASVIVSGPFGADGAGDTPSRERIFTCRPGTGAAAGDRDACAREILATTARRAYRRPVSEADIERLLPFYEEGVAESGFERGVQRAIERMLVSPEFLFRIERDPEGAAAGDTYEVSQLELASRLSFFLWASIPDDELLDLASQGRLRDPGVLDAQVRRMLADPRSEALVTNFAEQWLYLRDVELKEPDAGYFPEFDENLRQAFRREMELFVDSVLRGGESALELMTASHTFVNERLAKHYGIPHVVGSRFRRVELEDEARRGLLGKGAILTLTSYANRTSPVLRGKWILENLLSSPPPPPPPNVPALQETTDDGQPRSMREAMEQHRANPACASCHQQMDPLGFALENFDAIGRWRTRSEAGNAIDASGQLPSGASFEGPSGLRGQILASPELFVTTIVDKLLMYALGRNIEPFDQPTVRAIVREAGTDDYRFATIVSAIVQSTPFQMRKAES